MMLWGIFFKSLGHSLKLGIKDKGMCLDVFGVWSKIVREEKEY